MLKGVKKFIKFFIYTLEELKWNKNSIKITDT